MNFQRKPEQQQAPAPVNGGNSIEALKARLKKTAKPQAGDQTANPPQADKPQTTVSVHI